jgi:hypothetical protein
MIPKYRKFRDNSEGENPILMKFRRGDYTWGNSIVITKGEKIYVPESH